MVKKILIFFILNISLFAFKISDIDLDIRVKEGEKQSKVFTIINDKEYPLRYRASIEDNKKEIAVIPNNLLIPAYSEKDFEIEIVGKGKGEKSYFLVLEEEALELKSNNSHAKINMKYRIEHKYIVD